MTSIEKELLPRQQNQAKNVLEINEKSDDLNKLMSVETEESFANGGNHDEKDDDLRSFEVETKPAIATNRFKAVVAINLNAIFMFIFICSIKVASA